jgi:N-methylhydantoinase A
MEKAIRVVSVERGRDPRDFALVAFGGAGGLHACALAEALGIPQVIVPAFPGALSALGILASDIVKDYSRTVLWRVVDKIPHARLAHEFAALEKQAAQDFKNESWQGRVNYTRSVDLRYQGQGYELNLPLTKNLLKDFRREHQRRYGYAHGSREVELVTLRLRSAIKSRLLKTSTSYVGTTAPSKSSGQAPGRPGRTKLGSLSPFKATVLFEGKRLATTIVSRDELKPGKIYFGPAIVTEYSATTAIPRFSRFRLDKDKSLIIALR